MEFVIIWFVLLLLFSFFTRNRKGTPNKDISSSDSNSYVNSETIGYFV